MEFEDFASLGNFDFVKNKRDLNIPRIHEKLLASMDWFYLYSDISATDCRNYWTVACVGEHPSIRYEIPSPSVDDVVYANLFMCDGYWAVNFSRVTSPEWNDFLAKPKDYVTWLETSNQPDYAEMYIRTRDWEVGRLFSQQTNQYNWETSFTYGLSLLDHDDFEISHTVVVREIEKGLKKDVEYLERIAQRMAERQSSVYLLDTDPSLVIRAT